MSLYCYAPETTVLDGPRTIPSTWTDPATGVTYTNFDKLTDPQLLSFGWKPYSENDPGSPGVYYTRTLSAFNVTATNVTRDVVYTPWDIEDIKRSKVTELEQQIIQYTTNQLSSNPKVSEYVRNDEEWLAEQEMALARLTDWQQVADFDTVKPQVMTLANQFVGRSFVRQGTELTAQNQSDEGSGLTARWDQPTINSFIAANQAAANDPSNSTPPVSPTSVIRQGVATVSEQFNRILIWRFDVEGETDPNLDRSMAMQMTNRQDNRDIYAFIYTGAGATYLGWKLFEDQGNGVWKWFLDKGTPEAGDGAIMIWTDSDIAFILSYGANPAVEADHFTDMIQFPAGVEEKLIRVAWDPV